MSEYECRGCTEYRELSRRGFLRIGSAALVAAGVPAWLPRVVFANSFKSNRDVLIYIFLRGGCDGLTMCVPYADPAYATLRSATLIQPPGGSTNGATDLNGFFGLPPALSSLLEPYQAGKLAIVHATGFNVANPSRSHFDAERFVELGKFNDPALYTGWLGRHLGLVPAIQPTAPVRAIAVANGLQVSLQGAPKALPVPGLAQSNSPNFGLTGPSGTRPARLASIGTMYAATTDPLMTSAATTQATIDMLNMIGFPTYSPQGGAVYPTSSFGYSLKSAAALIRANVGVEAIAIDRGGWDTHSAQGVNPGGTMYNLMADLAAGLLAFHRDIVSNSTQNVVVCVQSEFGRRAAENGSQGLDHGYGNVMMLLGHRINGGQVLSMGTNGLPGWPGLGPGQLFQNMDLKVTLDFRDVLGEVVQNLLGNSDLASVFPGYSPTFRGITVP